MVTAVSPLRTGITRSTRPPMLPLTKSSLSTFIQEPQLLPALSSPKHHSPCTPPARTPHRHSHDGSTRERHHPFLARRSSASTFGGGEAREDGFIDTPPPPSPVSVSDRKAPSAASLPSTPAEAPRRTAPAPGAGAAHVDHPVPVRSLSLALPLKAPPSVGTPLLVDVAERPEDERPATMINSQMDRAHSQGRRRGSKRGTESVELKIALDQIVDCASFEDSLLGPEDTDFQAFPARTGFKVPFAPVDIPERRDERAGDASESHRHGRSLDLDAVTERNMMANDRGLGKRAGAADAYKRHSCHLSLSSVASIDASGGRHSVGDSESVTSATGLLHAAAIRVPSRSRPPPLELNLVPAPTAPCELSRLPPSLGSRSDLSPGRKAQLVRRTRKLERVLGEPLHEKHVEQYVVEPSLSTTTVMTKLEEGVWPDTPTGGLPEWARADVVPRCESRTEEVDEEPPSASRRLAHQRSRSGLGLSRMRSLMGRDTPPPAKIVVNLTREVRTTETQVRSSPMIRHSANRDDQQQPPTPETPRSIMTVSTIETHEEASRRQRRQQLAKLQRLLGVHIPPHALHPREDDLVPRCTPQGRSASESSLSLQSGVSHVSSSETGRARLAARLLRTMHAGPRMSTTESLQPAFNDADTMSRAEKAVARKRASKLEQMFGRVPPQDMFLPVRGRASVDLEGLRKRVAGDNSDAASPTSAHAYASALAALSGSPPSRPVGSTVVDEPVASTDLIPSVAFTSYRDSIRSLIWLVENDQGRLASIVDEIAELEDAAPPNRRSSFSSIDFGRATVEATRARSPRSPRSPMALIQSIGRATGLVAEPLSPSTPEASAHSVARRRTRKLSAFFGERVDPAHAHVMHHHHAHMHSLPSAHPPHTHAPAIPSSFHAVPGNYTARHSRPPSAMHGPRTSVFGFAALAEPSGMPRTAARRRETFDGVLGELWRNVQAEAAQGRMRSTEFGNLREMWSRLGRQRAQSGAWAEL
ncbi:uncharacterized protein CcaverHIS019_0109630 [Cutaneotrichosporon cavernicola]|uniref:Uncharacterized protein n=1 Tax=Cutaneotrichosporon cavernicola TaxID=279322 RepID=A0AA48I704_9TREE|nr:uncharacterized protein CcaverHIS019_0109630 [Cutaneotrichosporon cavernicola]BEI88245.1 hypothetical protein CcaverHIS019_0109630 [Cutaneotrichosporon cavernicola]BEI96017.1 hypothetical protein CcaverHIS631_0109660 [Cutaneotrichosporon cavernicola]BEJ03790.1 hypothetical protein CcaverHIS641_0109650 [Cutaneotrichosporon cavernicola]